MTTIKDEKPVAWIYSRNDGRRDVTLYRLPFFGSDWTETPLYLHPVESAEVTRPQDLHE